ncbi:MAG: oligosaccharide flippase family protein [Candidatus Kariarchaeaceae archaeon]|jgi:O-antigen/teichoic acid export membrane protein
MTVDSPPTQLPLQRRSIINNILTLFSGSAITQGLTAVILLLTARQLGPEQYGQYASSMALVTSLSIIFSLGLNLWLLRAGGKDPASINILLGSVIAIKSSIGIVWFGLIYLLSPLLQSNSLPTELVRVAAFAVLVSNLFATTLTAFKAILRNKVTASFEVASITGQLIVTLVLVMNNNQNAIDYLQSRSVILAISFITAIIVALILLGIKIKFESAKIALFQSPPFAASELLAWMFMRVDLLIVAMKLGDYSAGIYSTSAGFINALFLIPNTIGFVIVPVLSNLFSSNIKQGWSTAKRSLILLLFVGIALFVGIRIGSEILVLILGPAYSETQEILKILSIIILFQSINYGTAAILVATNQQAKRTLVQFGAVTLNIVLNLLIVDRAGLEGVAYVYVLTVFLLMIGYGLFVLRYRIKTKSMIVES